MNYKNNSLLISDLTLRDGNHALSHQISEENIRTYCTAANEARVHIVEVGHGNGIGASSLLVGQSAVTDKKIIEVARECLTKTLLGVHIIPGFATIERDIKPLIEQGVDVFRIASHCTEADITEQHIEYCRSQDKKVFGVLMMSHMASKETILQEASKMQAYGASAIIIMDSSGHYLPDDVKDRVSALVDHLHIPVGFHAHNNLGMAVANSVAAINSGAQLIDGCARGFGAGAGNTQLEVLVAVLEKMDIKTGIDFYKILDAADIAEKEFIKNIPYISSVSVVSGVSGVFSGFLKPVNRIAAEFDVDPRDVFYRLGERKAVAGQEDLIIEIVKELKDK